MPALYLVQLEIALFAFFVHQCLSNVKNAIYFVLHKGTWDCAPRIRHQTGNSGVVSSSCDGGRMKTVGTRCYKTQEEGLYKEK